MTSEIGATDLREARVIRLFIRLIYYASAGDTQLEGASSALLPCVSAAEVSRLGGRLAHPESHIL